MSGAPLVTAVLPTYRRPNLLKRAIKSVLAQKFADLEVLVADDASGDETETVVGELMRDRRLKYVCNPKNVGANENFAKAVSLVKTKYFSLMGDDEILLPEFYRSTVSALEQNPQVAFACAPVAVLGANRKMIWRRPDYFPPGTYVPPVGFQRMMELGIPTLTGIIFRTSIRDEIGGLDPKVGHYWDFEFIARAGARYAFMVTDTVGAIWNEDAQSPYRSANKHLLPGFPQAQHWWRKIENSYGLPVDLARGTVATLHRRYGKTLYHAALDWAAAGDIDDVAQAHAILVALDHPKKVPLGRVLSVARVAPAALKLYHLKRMLSDSPFFAGRKARKARRKFGDFLVYEKIIQEFD
jgi:glycosyltransferase involved in cell wall biosynthesis